MSFRDKQNMDRYNQESMGFFGKPFQVLTTKEKQLARYLSGDAHVPFYFKLVNGQLDSPDPVERERIHRYQIQQVRKRKAELEARGEKYRGQKVWWGVRI